MTVNHSSGSSLVERCLRTVTVMIQLPLFSFMFYRTFYACSYISTSSFSFPKFSFLFCLPSAFCCIVFIQSLYTFLVGFSIKKRIRKFIRMMMHHHVWLLFLFFSFQVFTLHRPSLRSELRRLRGASSRHFLCGAGAILNSKLLFRKEALRTSSTFLFFVYSSTRFPEKWGSSFSLELWENGDELMVFSGDCQWKTSISNAERLFESRCKKRRMSQKRRSSEIFEY